MGNQVEGNGLMSYSDCGLDGHSKDELFTCLKCYEDEVAASERQGIIRLIEDFLNDRLVDSDGNTIWSSDQDWSGLREAIKLIKGMD